MGTHGSFKSEGFYRFDSLAGGRKKGFSEEKQIRTHSWSCWKSISNSFCRALQLSLEEISFAHWVHFVVTSGSVLPVELSPTFHPYAADASETTNNAATGFMVAIAFRFRTLKIGVDKMGWVLAPKRHLCNRIIKLSDKFLEQTARVD